MYNLKIYVNKNEFYSRMQIFERIKFSSSLNYLFIYAKQINIQINKNKFFITKYEIVTHQDSLANVYQHLFFSRCINSQI